MIRFLITVIGLVMLGAAAAVLWTAHGPQPKQELTTGGVLYAQQEVAAQIATTGDANLGAVSDSTSGTLIQPGEVQFEAAAISDINSGGDTEAVTTTSEVGTAEFSADVPLTTDIVLQEDTGVEVAPLTTAGVGPGDGQGGFTTTTAGYEQRVVELEWPKKYQVGRAGAIRIKLKMLEGGALQPVAEVAGNDVIATPILLTDRYATHNAFVTATLSAPDFDVSMVTSDARQALQPGGEVEWRWTLKADNSTTAIISLGLAITWEPKPGSPPGPTNVPIWGQTVQVECEYVFGLITVPQASVAGTALAVLGFVAQIPFADKILETFFKVFFGRRRRDSRRSSSRRSRRY